MRFVSGVDTVTKEGNLFDKAEELNVDKVEPHIAEMFSRKPSQSKESTETETEDDNDIVSNDNIDKDNSVKDVTDSGKEKDKEVKHLQNGFITSLTFCFFQDELEKVPQKNGQS